MESWVLRLERVDGVDLMDNTRQRVSATYKEPRGRFIEQLCTTLPYLFVFFSSKSFLR